MSKQETTQDFIRMLHEQTEQIQKHFGGKTLITLTEAADYLHRSEQTLSADITFPVKRCGGRWNVSVVRMANWLLT